jgi:hypothetical protein
MRLEIECPVCSEGICNSIEVFKVPEELKSLAKQGDQIPEKFDIKCNKCGWIGDKELIVKMSN